MEKKPELDTKQRKRKEKEWQQKQEEEKKKQEERERKREEGQIERKEIRKKEHEKGEKKLVQWVVAVFCFFLLITSLSFFFSAKIGILIFVGVVIYALTAFKIISSNQIGVIRLWGEAVMEVHAGLCFVPGGICELALYSKETQVIEIGSPLENDEGKAITGISNREGVIINDLPLRITLKGETKGEDVLDRPLTIDPRVQLQFVIKDAIIFDQQKRSISRAANELVDVVKSSLQKLFGNKTPKEVLERISSGIITNGIQSELEWLIGEPESEPPTGESEKNRKQYWGIDVTNVGITTPGLPRRVNEALANAREGEIEAGKEQIKRTKEGLGDAAARVALLEAEAAGLTKKAELAKSTEGQLVLQLEATQQMLKNTEKIIITPSDGLMGTISSMFQGVKATIKDPSKTIKENETEKVTG